MHSSRMRTARLLTVFQHALLGGGYLPGGGRCTCLGVYLLGEEGCTCLGGVPAQGDVPVQGDVPAQGVYLPRGCTFPGVYLPRGCTFPGGVPARGVPVQVLHPPVNRMTDRCKNIALPQICVFCHGCVPRIPCVPKWLEYSVLYSCMNTK